jgi:hypothetical protein
VLVGCGDPISNDVLLEEAEFLAALPGAERLAPPREIFLAPNGDAELLRAAKGASAAWDRLVGALAASGDGLRGAAESAERSEVARRWFAVNVAHHFAEGDPLGVPAGSADWFVTGEILRTGETTFEWTLAVAATADAVPVEVAVGVHEPTVGSFLWDAEATAAALGLEPPAEVGALEVDYTEIGDQPVERTVEGAQLWTSAIGPTWAIAGDATLGFDAPVSVTTDGLAWPAHTAVVHGAEGGRAEGQVQQDGIDHAFSSCWDADGQTSWLGGDDAISAQGSESSCTFDGVATPEARVRPASVTADRRGAG